MEVTDRLETPADLLPQKEAAVPTGWTPEPVWTLWRSSKPLPGIDSQLLSLCINWTVRPRCSVRVWTEITKARRMEVDGECNEIFSGDRRRRWRVSVRCFRDCLCVPHQGTIEWESFTLTLLIARHHFIVCCCRQSFKPYFDMIGTSSTFTISQGHVTCREFSERIENISHFILLMEYEILTSVTMKGLDGYVV
jgi:hypothetical protein